MQNITKEKLIDILKTKAIDCFIHNDLLVVDIPSERMVVKNIKNTKELLDVYLYNLDNRLDKSRPCENTFYTHEEINLIKFNYTDINYLSVTLKRDRKSIENKICELRRKGIIEEYEPLQKLKIEGIIDNIRHSRISLDDKSKILLEVGRNIRRGIA